MYVVQRLTIDEFENGKLEGEPRLTEVFRSDSMEDTLRYWQSYASGASDWEAEFSEQNFSEAVFHRIVVEE